MQNTQTDTLETVGIPSHGKRIDEMDFLKAVFIILMITFHLTFIGNTYPYAKQLVYTFHVPAFLVISGYFVSIGKPWGKFLKSMWWIFLPYAVMECGYTVMASVLPIRDHIDGLSFFVVVRNVFATPLGPYWYLHTLVLCSMVYYFIFHYLRLGDLSRFIVLGVCFYVLSQYLHVVSFANACYFMAGAVVRRSGLAFLDVVKPSLWVIIPIVLIALDPVNLDRHTIAGAVMVYLVMSLCLFCFRYLRGRARALSLFIGRNTLVLLVFSPVFTVLTKLFQPYLLRVDGSGILFMVVAVIFTVAGCFGTVYVMDWLHLSRYFFGQEKELK
jgi:fucose 4-O-acetylase-like acetyltransferase